MTARDHARTRVRSRRVRLGALVLLLGLALWRAPATSAESATEILPPVVDVQTSAGTETAVLAGGCFWGVQAVFQHVKGVTQVYSGYSGGAKDTARYDMVGTGRTGHAEAVEITFDPRVISYGKILQVYFSVAHDPTQRNRQGPDVGTQYRSDIFAKGDEQTHVAANYIAQLDKAGAFKRPIATQVSPLSAFYRAEAYHQDYATLHPNEPYIAYNDLPKIANLKRLFPELYQASPVLVTARPH